MLIAGRLETRLKNIKVDGKGRIFIEMSQSQYLKYLCEKIQNEAIKGLYALGFLNWKHLNKWIQKFVHRYG